MVGIEHTLGNVTVGDIMTRQPILVPQDESLAFVYRRMVETKHTGFPVADAQGRPVGFVGLEELGRVDAAGLAATRIHDAMREAPPIVSSSLSAAECLRVMASSRHGQVLIARNGTLEGIATQTDLERIVAILSARKQSPTQKKQSGGDVP